MRSGPAAIAGLALALALLLSACGEGESAATGAGSGSERTASEARRAAISPTGAVRSRPGRDPVAQRQCRRSLADFLDAIESLTNTVAAANAWGECLADACDLAEVEPRLQRQWARASSLLGEAQAGLRAPRSS